MANNTYLVSSDQLTAENIFLDIGGRSILKGVTISASKGSITGLLGRNGSGKSTMLQSVFGTRKAAECDVFVNGIKIKTPYTYGVLVNYLPQQPFLPPQLTVRKIMQHYETKVYMLQKLFPEIEGEMNKQVHELSGGMERLISVLVILLANTRFTLLDEPFSHIMPLHVERLQQLLRQQAKRKGIVITDHMYQTLLAVSDTVYLMKDGKSIYIRDKQDLVLHGYLSSPFSENESTPIALSTEDKGA